jgi:hypothetical protein
VLFATSIGSHPVAPVLDGLLATALWLRGEDPVMVLCDGALPACEACAYVSLPVPDFVSSGPRAHLCAGCTSVGRRATTGVPFDRRPYGTFVTPESAGESASLASSLSLDECFTFALDGLRLGEQTRASVLRFYGKADLSDEDAGTVLGVARRYAQAAIASARATEAMLREIDPDVVVAHHGVYVPQGVLGEVCRRNSVRLVNWGTSYRDRTFIFSHGNTYHFTMLDEPDTWSETHLTFEQEQRLLTFLLERRRGKGDWAWVTPEAALRVIEQERDAIARAVGLDLALPTVGLLTNVLWDAQLYYAGHAFADMLDWLSFTIEHFRGRSDIQLLIRIHPHEIKHGNRQPVAAEIARRHPSLPPNIHVVDYDSPLNTYALMDMCSAVLLYGTKTGVELAPFGIPVVVCGDAWIRGKGITIDVTDRDQYREVLAGITSLERLDEATVERARRYAYHYFFRRMIPITSFVAGAPTPTVGASCAEDLRPGRDPGLDKVLEGILEGTPFIHDD